MKKQIIISLRFLILVTILTGIIYPFTVTAFSFLFFREKAAGSLVEKNGVIIGSKLIGQDFNDEKYFWPRPSAVRYNPLPSGGSNLGPLNPVLLNEVNKRRESFLLHNNIEPGNSIPPEMLYSSASGLDPHISREAALLQVGRVAKARGYDEMKKKQLEEIIYILTEKRQFSLLGEPRINVFLLNLKTDSLK